MGKVIPLKGIRFLYIYHVFIALFLPFTHLSQHLTLKQIYSIKMGNKLTLIRIGKSGVNRVSIVIIIIICMYYIHL